MTLLGILKFWILNSHHTESDDESFEKDRSLSFEQRKRIKELLKQHMSLLKANESVKQTERQLRHFYNRFWENQNSLNQVRYNYFKELQSLKEMIYRQKKYPESFEYMNVEFFSALEIVDERTRELLNSKIEDVKNLFNEKMFDLYKNNKILQRQIFLFNEIEKTGNIGIKFSEMTCDDIIIKLQIVEDDPTKIWKTLQKYYGFGFFNVMIEKEFGINPETHEEIAQSFVGQISSIKIDAIEKLEGISEQVSINILIYVVAYKVWPDQREVHCLWTGNHKPQRTERKRS